MPTDALDDYITPYVLGDEAWMERLRPDAWIAMWARRWSWRAHAQWLHS